MKENFDYIKNRANTPSYKCNKDFLKKVFGKSEVLPLWIADMDFDISDPIKEAIKEKTDFGVFGYEYTTDSQKNSIINWYSKYHGLEINKEELKFIPSVLTGISVAINELTNEGDGVIIQPPVYSPFGKIIKSSNRKVIKNELKFEEGKYSIDFDDLREKAKDENTKMILIANPHNPVGRVWTTEELSELGDIATENDLIILSDDIHADIVYKDYKYTAIASLSEEIAKRTITLLSPGKTFNISGISTAVMITSNEKYVAPIDKFLEKYHMGVVANSLSMVAFEAGYASSRVWFEDMMSYVTSNLEYIRGFLDNELSSVKLVEPEGTYLAWLDLNKLGMEADKLQEYLVEEANLGLDYGHWFGGEGAGFVRVNMATSKETIEKAMHNLKTAIDKL